MARKAPARKGKNVVDMRVVEREDVQMSSENPVSYEIPEEPVVQLSQSRHVSKVPLFLLVCVLVALGATFYFYSEWRGLRENPQAETEKEMREMVVRVRRLIDVPQGEVPALVRITDTKPLEDQIFFKNAKKGNVILFYAVARKAYLYDPEEDIIVEVATLGDGSQI